MKNRAIALLLGVVGTVSASQAISVYVTTSGSTSLDNLVVTKLTGFGHTVTLGTAWHSITASTPLSNFDAVYFQANHNWTAAMSEASQQAVVDYVQAGGGLVTSEWTIYNIGVRGTSSNGLQVLGAAMPSTYGNSWHTPAQQTYTRNAVDPTVGAGLPSSFTFGVQSISGGETLLLPKSGATRFFNTGYTVSGVTGAGLVGWGYGAGRVLNFSTVNGDQQWNDPNFSRLVSNSLVYAAVPEPATMGAMLIGLAALARRRRR